MSKEVTARINLTPTVLLTIQEKSIKTNLLSPVTASYWKPVNKELKNYPPHKEVTRLYIFEDGSATVNQLKTSHRKNGTYTHTKEIVKTGTATECKQALNDLGYEPWIEYRRSAIEYLLNIDGETLNVLEETFDDESETLKFEAESEETIWKFLQQFGLDKTAIISKNTAEILAEKNNLLDKATSL